MAFPQAKQAVAAKPQTTFKRDSQASLVKALTGNEWGQRKAPPSKPGGKYAKMYGTPEEWSRLRRLVADRDGWRCRRCGKNVRGTQWHCHHLRPLSRGGTSHPSNLVCLCIACHESQHDHLREKK